MTALNRRANKNGDLVALVAKYRNRHSRESGNPQVLDAR
jgi:hypothetical protein